MLVTSHYLLGVDLLHTNSPLQEESTGKGQLSPSLIMMVRMDLKGMVGVRQRESVMGESRNRCKAVSKMAPCWTSDVNPPKQVLALAQNV